MITLVTSKLCIMIGNFLMLHVASRARVCARMCVLGVGLGP